MKLEDKIKLRAGNGCELCGSTSTLEIMEVEGQEGRSDDNLILVCDVCKIQIEKKAELDTSHWQLAMTNSMWSEVPGVQVVVWRLLNRMRNESWAAESIDMMYLDDERMAWAKKTGDHVNEVGVDLHRDSNGHILQNGDSVVLVKSLDVKGSTINAKMGTVVRNIHLVKDNTEQIEGKVEGQLIVILTKYVRRQN